MYIIQSLLYCMCASKGKRALAPKLLAICCLLGLVYLIVETVTDAFYYVESLMHSKRCICFTETEVKSVFVFYCLWPVLDMWIFFALSGKSRDSPYTAQGADGKVLLEGETKVFWCWFLSPQRTLRKERCGEVRKVFPLCSCLADLDCPWGEGGLHVW